MTHLGVSRRASAICRPGEPLASPLDAVTVWLDAVTCPECLRIIRGTEPASARQAPAEPKPAG